jgi:hypothetical protein
MIETYYFKIEGITKDTYDDLVAFVMSINKDLDFVGGVENENN